MPAATLLTPVDAKELLSDLHRPFASAHLDAWGRWDKLREICLKAEAPELLLPLTATTRANYVNNHCVDLIRTGVTTSESVSIVEINGLTAVLAHGGGQAAFVRFKLLSRDFAPSNVRTNVQKALSRQEWPENLFHALGIAFIPTVLTCGYRMAIDQTSISGVYVCCHYRSELLWSYPITDAAGGIGDLEVLPIPDMPSPRPRIVSSIIPEKESNDADDAGSQ